MATPVFRPSSCIWQGSSTSTTGGDITLNIVATSGKLNFRDKYADGTPGVPLELYDSTTGNQEFSYGTIVYGASAGFDKITSRVITYSTNGPATPVAWGSGTRNAFCNVAAESFLFAENALAEMNDTQASNALIRLSGATKGINGLTGGSDKRVVRYSSSTVVTNAQNSDSSDDLGELLFLAGGTYYRSGDLVKGLTSLGYSTGQILWLGTNASPFLTAQPTASSSLRVVRLGRFMSADAFLFKPNAPVTR